MTYIILFCLFTIAYVCASIYFVRKQTLAAVEDYKVFIAIIHWTSLIAPLIPLYRLMVLAMDGMLTLPLEIVVGFYSSTLAVITFNLMAGFIYTLIADLTAGKFINEMGYATFTYWMSRFAIMASSLLLSSRLSQLTV